MLNPEAQLTIVRIDPPEEIAAEPDTLDLLTATLRCTLTERFQEPITTGEIGSMHGFPLVPDPTLPPGLVQFRPRPTRGGRP